MALNISGGLSGAGTGAAIGSAIPGIGTAAGAIAGGVLGLFSGGDSSKKDKKLMKQAWEYEKEGMGLQYQYNNQMAEANQERNKELWDYTNFEAQRKHLEQAGLSVGLMYGNGGAMGASTSGGQGSGVQKPGNPTEAAIQSKALGIQMQQMQSQTALNAASAAKQMAEAEKIKGVDTDAVKASIDNIIAQTNNEEAKNGLIYAQKRAAEIEADLNNANIEEQQVTITNAIAKLYLEGFSNRAMAIWITENKNIVKPSFRLTSILSLCLYHPQLGQYQS